VGFFDNIKLSSIINLPEFEGNILKTEWQTKDIQDPCMDTYLIKDNRLIKICHEWEEVPMGERVNVAGMNVPLIRPKKTWEEDTNYHGKFNFYTMIQEPGDTGKDVWYEYQAKFTDGELVNINIVAKNAEYSRRTLVLSNDK
jgi:hypothetical protein